ncbi:MAG: beta-N-acetylhexosaminidase [Sphingomonadales bacterium]
MTPLIFGLDSFKLSKNERSFLKEADPAGIILFTRNVDNPDQVQGLTDSVRDALGRDLLVLIDQEGGRVQRLNPPHWRQAPAMAFFGKVFEKNPEVVERALYLNCQLIGLELAVLGINVDCLPVLDVPVTDADEVIGDRALSNDPGIIGHLGAIAANGIRSAGVLGVMKHIPGHGRANVDSHKALPIVDTPLSELEATDFLPFEALKACPFAMTAHVIYAAVDPEHPATLSKTVIQSVIRGKIGFEGLLISDDLTMKALKGDMTTLTEKCLAAGIDLVLHCSANMNEMEAVLKGAPSMPEDKKTGLMELLEHCQPLPGLEYQEGLMEYEELEQKLKSL